MNMLITSGPHLYDRWEDQLALEEEMLSLGKDRMKSKIEKARMAHDMTSLRPYRSLIHEWVLPVSKYLSEWCEAQTKKRGVRPIALPLLLDMDHDAVAVCALKTILRMMGVKRRGVMAVAYEIGTWVEHEARAAAWIEADEGNFRGLEHNQKHGGSNATHIRRSRISIFNKHVSEKIEWENWADEERRRVGLQMIDIVIQATRRFSIMPDPEWAPPPNAKFKPKSRPLILEGDTELMNWLASATDDELLHSPVFMPTVVPPKPWTGPRDGGYWTPFVKTPFLVRFKANHESQRQRAIDDYEALDMPEVYSALNRVQETPWKINKRVFEVAMKMWEMDIALAGLPRKEQLTVPERPIDADTDDAVRKKWASEASGVRKTNATRISHYISYDRCLKLATRFADEPCFYFPHMLDFRGRMYPIPNELSPQGEDLHRGLLTFARGKLVQPEDAGWLAVQVANCFGVDKVSIDDRIAWVEARESEWIDMAEDPMTYREWAAVDIRSGEPKYDSWQALAAVFEWVDYLKARAAGLPFVSALPVRVDGTCNGIQHLSAMVRDEVGGRAVNIIPSDSPKDIYQDVADLLTEILRDHEEDPKDDALRARWEEILGGKANRSLTKRPVMILPYGGTQHAYFKYTLEWVDENVTKESFGDDKDKYAMVGYMVRKLWKAIKEEIKKPREVMEWLQQCADKASATGLPLYWKTPVGFVVRQFYGTREMTQVKTNIDGQRYDIAAWNVTPIMDRRAQATGIAPNFVHSMDASALMECVNLAFDNGIECITTIHDSYGSVAADMWRLYGCVREAFILTHTEPVLENFRAACQEVVPEVTDWPKSLKFGTLDIEAARHSDYFFA